MSLKQFALRFRIITRESNSIRPARSVSHAPVLLLLGLFFLPALLPAQELSRKELEDRRKQLIQEIKLTNRMLSKTQKSRQVTLDRYMALQRQIRAREALLATLRQELQYVEVKLDRTGEVILALESDLDRLREEYAHMLRIAYRQKATQSGLWFILSAVDLNEGFRRWQYLRQYEKYRQKQAERIEETVRTLEEEKIELDARKAEKERLLLAEAHQKEVWAKELVEKNRMLQNLKQNESRLTAELKEKRQAHERLNQAIEKIIRAEVARRQEESRNSTMSSVEDERKAADKAIKLTSDFAGNKGKLPWPVKNGVITTSFGRQPHPTLQNITIVNNGIDLLTEQRDRKSVV